MCRSVFYETNMSELILRDLLRPDASLYFVHSPAQAIRVGVEVREQNSLCRH